jgi:hypothetical protein
MTFPVNPPFPPNEVDDVLKRELVGVVAAVLARSSVGIVVWPVWFAMDAKGAASTDAAALKARQEYLVNLAGQRCAGGRRPPAAPPSPPR